MKKLVLSICVTVLGNFAFANTDLPLENELLTNFLEDVSLEEAPFGCTTYVHRTYHGNVSFCSSWTECDTPTDLEHFENGNYEDPCWM